MIPYGLTQCEFTAAYAVAVIAFSIGIEQQRPLLLTGLHLCEAAIHKQFRSSDLAAVVRREKDHGLGDLIGCPEAAEWNHSGNHLPALRAGF